ncbi:MAG TPA: hypothetical protein VFO16_16180 [Pseudonocardiaceae bacterium]|nr:hypothetical protein [Pseudonocardiaceae bacterium]
MLLVTTQAGLLAAELEARGFLRGAGRTILIVIIALAVVGAELVIHVMRPGSIHGSVP